MHTKSIISYIPTYRFCIFFLLDAVVAANAVFPGNAEAVPKVIVPSNAVVAANVDDPDSATVVEWLWSN